MHREKHDWLRFSNIPIGADILGLHLHILITHIHGWRFSFGYLIDHDVFSSKDSTHSKRDTKNPMVWFMPLRASAWSSSQDGKAEQDGTAVEDI